MSDLKIKTYNVRKNKRFQSKKRKLEALLDLVQKDNAVPGRRRKGSGNTLEENYKALKEELKKYQPKPNIEPLFYLIDCGKQAQINFPSNKELSNCKSPLFVEDVYHLILRSVVGNVSPFQMRWAKLEQAQNVCKTVLLEIEGLTDGNVSELHSELNQNSGMIPYVVEVVSSDIPFATELSTLHLATDFYSRAKDNYSSLFPMDKSSVIQIEKPATKNAVSKLQLLLSPIQLAMENFPLPESIFEHSKSDGYQFSKSSYIPVTNNSPMFAIDCEMCLTAAGKSEVTRVALVNEDLETVYHSFVKPKSRIIDYRTKYSGITPKLLRNVTTTLRDVQKNIRKILPGDAILCGQSLNCDLHALEIIHPYVIDTSIIFNNYGIRKKKTSLKKLVRMHLKEAIQEGKSGHNPIEDSIATMKLVLLKLKKSVEYGDAVLSSGITDVNSSEISVTPDNNTPCEPLKFSDFMQLNTTNKNGLFPITSRFSKKVCLIGCEDSLSNYAQEMITDNVTKVIKSKSKKIIRAISDNVENFDLLIDHLIFDSVGSSIAQLSDDIKQVYDSLPLKTLFIIFVSGTHMSSNENFRHSFCMISLKK